MTHVSDAHPYRNTRVSYEKSKSDIQEMLVEAGAVALNWKESVYSLKKEAMPILEFGLEIKLNDRMTRFAVRINAKMLMTRKGNRYSAKVADPNASMRLLYWYIKARLEGVRWGLEDIFEAFFSRIINSLPDGTTATVVETAKKNPAALKAILPTFTLDMPALPATEVEIVEEQ